MSNSFDEAWPIMEAVAARDVGEDLDSCEKAALRAIPRTRFLFAPETLTFLHKGGRIGGAAALLGNMIQLAPDSYRARWRSYHVRQGPLSQEGA